MKIFLDTETIPSTRFDVVEGITKRHFDEAQARIDTLKAPANYGPEASAKWMTEKAPALKANMMMEAVAAADEEHRKQSLDPTWGEIACVSFAVDDDAPYNFFREMKDPDGEAVLLQGVAAALTRALEDADAVEVITFNGEEFDKPFLRCRGMVAGVKLPGCVTTSVEPWKATKVDVMRMWHPKKYVSMDTLCRVFRLPGKVDGIDGSMVWDLVREGRIDEVSAYCGADVERTRALYNRMMNRGVK
jgi:hypothetical protein